MSGRALQGMFAKGRLPPGQMNKTEAEFAQHLELQKRAGAILAYDFEPESFKLAKSCSYTPDFRVMLPDQTIVFYEVKGFWMEDARVKIKVAAKMHPMYKFVAVKKRLKRDGGGWQIEEF